jgi:hypothetical protein
VPCQGAGEALRSLVADRPPGDHCNLNDRGIDMVTSSVPGGAEAKLLGACSALEGVIESLVLRIKHERIALDEARSRLATLQSKPQPDTEQIQALKENIKKMADGLKEDEADHRQLVENFRENCG